MLKRALPPAILLLSACTSPEAQPPPRAEPPVARAPERPSGVIDRKPVPLATTAAQPTVPAVAESAHAGTTSAAEGTRVLFLANCAQCHGEKGDGEGVTQLDRKARSFLDGGFSYGNTKDAILRSITHGIPGTPMPAFGKALDDAQRVALAQYVIAFGPDQIVVDASESEMVVKDRPLIVRGNLPSIVEGAPEWPRGLAIGTPDGLTFEYRTDDVQLVGVRAGRFVNRTDWGERGGTALEMLGQLAWSATPEWNPTYLTLARTHEHRTEALAPRHARLIASQVVGDRAEIEYALTAGSGADQRKAHVRESCRAFRNRWGSGFRVTSSIRVEDVGFAVQVGVYGRGLHSMLVQESSSVHLGSSTWPSLDRPWLVFSHAWRRGESQLLSLKSSPVFALQPGPEQIIDVVVLTNLTVPIDAKNEEQATQILREFEL